MSESRAGAWLRLILGHSGTETDTRNQRRFLVWTAIWGATFIGGALLNKSEPAARLMVLAAIISILASLGALASYLRFFREADELTRRIQMEGLAFGFAIGTIAGLSYQMLEWAGAPTRDISDFVAVMLVAFAFGQIRATLRYR